MVKYLVKLHIGTYTWRHFIFISYNQWKQSTEEKTIQVKTHWNHSCMIKSTCKTINCFIFKWIDAYKLDTYDLLGCKSNCRPINEEGKLSLVAT